MSQVSSCVVKSSWDGSYLYLPSDDSISYFPMRNFDTEPKVSKYCLVNEKLLIIRYREVFLKKYYYKYNLDIYAVDLMLKKLHCLY